jgi:hypothetical protein
MQTPVSLVMRTNECFYCPEDGVRQVLIVDNFGLLCCKAHESAAERDCNAYLHTIGRVRFQDAAEALKPFFDALPSTFPTVRKSGAIDPGWSVIGGREEFLIRDNGEWYLRLEKRGSNLSRCASLRSFLDAGVPGVTVDLVESAIAALNTGLYAADVAAQKGLHLERVKEAAGVHKAVYDGVHCRIFVP